MRVIGQIYISHELEEPKEPNEQQRLLLYLAHSMRSVLIHEGFEFKSEYNERSYDPYDPTRLWCYVNGVEIRFPVSNASISRGNEGTGVNTWHTDGICQGRTVFLWSNTNPTHFREKNSPLVGATFIPNPGDVVMFDNDQFLHMKPPYIKGEQRYFMRVTSTEVRRRGE